MNDQTGVVPQPSASAAELTSPPGPGIQSADPSLIPWVLVIEAESESAALEHFKAILAGAHVEMYELSRGLVYSQVVESGRYWKFDMQPPVNPA